MECYRLYDADIPEYNVAVDLYGELVHVQEYAPPKQIDEAKAAERRDEILEALPQVLGCDPDDVFFKTRERQRGKRQYERLGSGEGVSEVDEAGLRFEVNLSDYLDTGLFLDHRMTRALVRDLAQGRRFLNLFAYTGSASVYAAAGGASSCLTVDMSATYLDWAGRNMSLNGFEGAAYRYEQMDCFAWVRESREEFDLIFLDPPTFSTSKRMVKTLDIQRDHVDLLLRVAKRLAPGGVLLFSNNFRRFKLDWAALEARLPGWSIEEISAQTIPPDFQRNPRIHCCFRLQRPQAG